MLLYFLAFRSLEIVISTPGHTKFPNTNQAHKLHLKNWIRLKQLQNLYELNNCRIYLNTCFCTLNKEKQ